MRKYFLAVMILGLLAFGALALFTQAGGEKPAAAKPAVGFVGPIEELTLKNNHFRQVIFTGKHSQLVVMSLQPGEEIGVEVHDKVDQFFRIEQGEAKLVFVDKEEHIVKNADAFIVPAGVKHNVINISKTTPLKVYTIYSPANHPADTLHKTKADAEEHEHH